MYYDLHIHSCLSPCANDDMTPHNIVNMAVLAGLDLIAVSDHNSVAQQANMVRAAKEAGIRYLCACEVQTAEEVHVLAYFRELKDAEAFGSELDVSRMRIPNKTEYFGHQYIVNEYDEVTREESDLLLTSVTLSIDEVCTLTHRHHGSFVLAHALDRSNSITTQLGFIPLQLEFDGIEIKRLEDKEKLLKSNPHINNTVWLISSDAHQLIDINDAQHQLTETELNRLWRNES